MIAFTLDTPPYVMDKGTTGIELDIVRAALKPKGYTFTVRQMTYRELANAVNEKGVDAAATVTRSDNGTFYSENYIAFKNAAITKQSAGLKIKSVADLKGKSILAWENAYEDLGPVYQSLFSPDVKEAYRKKYQEIGNQAEQVEMFWKSPDAAIVIDENVMKWFIKQLEDKVDTSAKLNYHRIFPAQTEFRISFKSKQVRDDFNAGLNQLLQEEKIQPIYDKYLK